MVLGKGIRGELSKSPMVERRLATDSPFGWLWAAQRFLGCGSPLGRGGPTDSNTPPAAGSAALPRQCFATGQC